MPTKKAYEITGSGIVLDSPGLYYGFRVVTGGVDRRFQAWDNPTTAAGTRVENYTCDGSFPTAGDINSDPVYLESGLYIGLDGGEGIVYAWENPLQG